jgi:pimeloyl-ACP methyl ester carboxylesterase
MELLSPAFHIVAADSYGAGKSPPRPAGRKVTLRDEAALVEPALRRAGERFSLVGHSYGGAVVAIVALERPERVRAMALYEPTLFSLVDQESPPPNDTAGICDAVDASAAALRAGDAAGAARCFIDFWMDEGAFDRMPERNRAAIVEAVKDVERWREALLGEPTPGAAFRSLDIPVLLLLGSRSPLSSRAVATRLRTLLPRVEYVELEGLGHMAPVTHPEAVNTHIARFLHEHGK